MAEKTQILDYGTGRPRKAWVAWQSLVAGFGGLVFFPSFECTCGYLGRDALLASVPAMLLAWWGFGRRVSFWGRLIATVVAVFVSVEFAKNLLDIGWFGHAPLFR